MNRVIKFEYGFSNHSPIKMTLVEQIQDFNQHYNPMSMGCIKYIRQYTGLLDKDGKEIYEGDIVKVNDTFVTDVIYSDGQFGVVTKSVYSHGRYVFEGLNHWEIIEVIGNIYQNPELLEEN